MRLLSHDNSTALCRKYFMLRWPCISLQILGNNPLDAPFHVFIYFMSLHVSTVTALIIRRSKCINTSSGMISLCKWLLGLPVRREMQFPSDRHISCMLHGHTYINNNDCEWDPVILTNYIICTSIFKCLYKYWPDDGLFRPKLVANIWNNKIKRQLCQTEYIFYSILIL